MVVQSKPTTIKLKLPQYCRIGFDIAYPNFDQNWQQWCYGMLRPATRLRRWKEPLLVAWGIGIQCRASLSSAEREDFTQWTPTSKGEFFVGRDFSLRIGSWKWWCQTVKTQTLLCHVSMFCMFIYAFLEKNSSTLPNNHLVCTVQWGKQIKHNIIQLSSFELFQLLRDLLLPLPGGQSHMPHLVASQYLVDHLSTGTPVDHGYPNFEPVTSTSEPMDSKDVWPQESAKLQNATFRLSLLQNDNLQDNSFQNMDTVLKIEISLSSSMRRNTEMDSEDSNRAFPYNISAAIHSLSLSLFSWIDITLWKSLSSCFHIRVWASYFDHSKKHEKDNFRVLQMTSCKQQQNSQIWGGLTKLLLWYIMIFPLWIRISPAWCDHVKHKILAINAWAPRYISITMIGQTWDVIGPPRTHTPAPYWFDVMEKVWLGIWLHVMSLTPKLDPWMSPPSHHVQENSAVPPKQT